MRAVAARAGVAVGTVSHYLNHPDRVSAERATRIREAIDELGFVPNAAGRQLRMGQGSALAYLAPDVSNPYFTEIAEEVERQATARGLALLLANSGGDRDREDAYLRYFEQQRAVGMLVSSPFAIEDRLAQLRRRGTPSVLLGQTASDEAQSSLAMDDVVGGRLATEHLLEQGCRSIAFVGGPLQLPQVVDRLRGASEAVEASGARLEVIEQSDRTIRGGQRIGERLLARPAAQRPDGVFAVNDLLALGLLQTLVDAGVRVPHELALIGYDDIEFGAVSLLPLSSVRGPHAEFGSAAVELLFRQIEDAERPAERIRVVPEVVPRASSVRR